MGAQRSISAHSSAECVDQLRATAPGSEPLLQLRKAVDLAASGNYLIDFDPRGEGEVVELAKSVRSLIAHARQFERHLATL
jgi:hypothetical protein